MEFQFGTNWSHFSRFAGGVIGQTLAMEGVFAFFLESTFLGLFLYGEKRLSQGMHWFAAFMVFVGSWLSGYFIIATDAWMQHPVGYRARRRRLRAAAAASGQLVLNPWAWWQYAHNMSGAVITGAFVMAAVGAFYLLSQKHVRAGTHLRARRRDRGVDRQRAATVPDRRRAGPHGRAQPAGDAGRDGSAVRDATGRAAGDHRPAQRRGSRRSTTRSSFPRC